MQTHVRLVIHSNRDKWNAKFSVRLSGHGPTTMIALCLWLLAGSLLAEDAVANGVPNFSVEQTEEGQPARWKFSSWKESQGKLDDAFAFEGTDRWHVVVMRG
ncbi:MAG: hypothetical protein ACKVJU_24180 [Verrucomicrobiales bacterium]